MKKENFEIRRKRVRAKISGTEKCPRVSVFRSNKFTYAQLIDDVNGKTLVFANLTELKEGKNKTDKAFLLGELLAKKALAKKIKKVVFDKSGYEFHGRIKSLAEGARKGGLVF
jgi:large subunit ribosomal protein L18